MDLTSSSVGSSNQQTSEFSSYSSQAKSTERSETALVSQIIAALTPSITQSVQLALAGQSQSVSVSSGQQQTFSGGSQSLSGSQSFSSNTGSSASSVSQSAGAQQKVSSSSEQTEAEAVGDDQLFQDRAYTVTSTLVSSTSSSVIHSEPRTAVITNTAPRTGVP